MEGFDDAFYQAHYSMPDPQLGPAASSSYSNAAPHPASLMSYNPTPGHFPPGSFAYPAQPSDLLAAGLPATFASHPDNFSFQSPVPHAHHHASSHTASFSGHVPHAMHPYHPLSAAAQTMPMSLDQGTAFPYDPAMFGASIGPLDPSLEQHSAPPPPPQQQQHHPHLPSQTVHLDPGAAYAVAQIQESATNTYWSQQTTQDVSAQAQAAGPVRGPAGDFSRAREPSQDHQPLPQSQPADFQSYTQPVNPAVPHRFIQPKRSSPVKASFPPEAKVEAGSDSPYASIYSSSGFDIMGVLAQVVSRPNPKINIGAVDLSCAFVLCDITLEDHPIVYVSEAFERLTGYTNQEIVGQNCRFLQGPDGVVQRGMQRKFVDENTAYRLRSTIEERTEIQASIINYRKGGQPFVNLITMLPIRWGGSDYRFYVGFQVDLVETPDAVTRRNPNGTYMINYQRSQLPSYVVPPEVYRSNPDLATFFTPDQVSTVLESLRGTGPSYRHYLDRMLVENMDDIIHVLSFEGEFLYLSPSCRKVLEYEPAELVGKGLSAVCHPSDIGSVIRDLRARITTEPVSVVYRIRKKYSGYIWFESHGSWHITDRGRQFMVLGGRARAVYNLDQVATIGRGGLAENDIWAKLSMSGIVLFISSKARPVLGRVADDVIGKSIQDLTGADTRAQVMEALDTARSGKQVSFLHKVRHKKGHMLPVQTTLIPGDSKEGERPSFLVAQLRFHRPLPNGSPDDTSSSATDTGRDVAGQTGSSSRLPSGNQELIPLRERSLFSELAPTRGSSWQFELRELEKQNRTLSDEVQRLLTRRKKRKRKQSTIIVEKSCAMCRTKSTPEWRRGPSGNRDLCNSCGLRWAKQVRNAAQGQTTAARGKRT
ncbi:GATA transcription factor LreA [Aspergillus vadensis CBS 113365]|uniref:GATA transcription factor LreA n=1 Tax=Aspergillus vadensis (strain CBS 113365 / IMI 142717 / IBT 24658) TaxID=1448311 RepID=A0A319B124_ASPVC|nr:GATA transcription factor LreA [Aspergillus vadensis CBS 113365]PYH63890.1 GATA transcription factor LreA [Aspergillus vadensis CBS 113365]